MRPRTLANAVQEARDPLAAMLGGFLAQLERLGIASRNPLIARQSSGAAL
jgi:hypothetical protein